LQCTKKANRINCQISAAGVAFFALIECLILNSVNLKYAGLST
jgi:hypothetical protein